MAKRRWDRLGLCAVVAAMLSGSAVAQIKVPSAPGADPGAPASAGQAQVYNDFPLGRSLDLAREVGFQNVKITKNSKKEDYIAGTVNGISSAIYREKCQDGVCNVLSFYAYFGNRLKANYTFMNAFNRAYFAKLIQVAPNSWTLEMNVLLYDGVSEDHIRQLARIFVASVKLAQDFKPS